MPRDEGGSGVNFTGCGIIQCRQELQEAITVLPQSKTPGLAVIP